MNFIIKKPYSILAIIAVYTLLLSLFSTPLKCQNTFSKKYNLFDPNSTSFITDLEIYKDSVYLLIGHWCADLNNFCAGLAISDMEGNIKSQISLPWMYSRYDNMIIKNDTIVISGHHDSYNDPAYFLYKCNLKGDNIYYKKYNIPGDIFTYNYGLEETESHYVLYGDTKLISEEIIGIIVWLHKDGSLDSVMFTPDNTQIVDSDIDTSGLLTLLYKRKNLNNRLFEHKGIMKFDSSKKVVWRWETEIRLRSKRGYKFTILSDNSFAMTEGSIEDAELPAVWKISAGGEVEWVYDLNPGALLNGPWQLINIIEAENGDILTCGEYYELNDPSFLGGYVCRFSPGGELLWDKYYSEVMNEKPLDGGFLTISETDQGNIIVGGNIRKKNDIEFDSWLMLLDENGCLEPECDMRNIISKALQIELDDKDCNIGISNTLSSNTLKLNVKNQDLSLRSYYYEIYNLSGLLQDSGNITTADNQSIDISHLISGIYAVIFYSKDGSPLCGQKFVKQ